MASTTALWLSIEAAFSEIEQLCIEARAAELALGLKQEQASLLKMVAGGRVRSLRPVPVDASAELELRHMRAAELSRDLTFREAHATGADLVEVRARVRKRLQWLRAELAAALTEHEVHYVLLPLVIYTDELMTSITRGQALRWEPLQSELYEIDNGGELFFTILEDHLRKSETHPLIFQMFYFCLSDGFVGMCENDGRKLDEYKARLAERIPLAPVDEGPPQPAPARVELVPFPWRAYAWAAFAIVVGWAALQAAAMIS
jgi:type VI protein secretion system component VasF